MLISTWNKTSQTLTYSNENAIERRSNLTGAIIRGAHPGKKRELMTQLVVMLQNRFNFSFQNVTWSERGSLSENGAWSPGVMNDLLEDKLDWGMQNFFI